MDAVNIATWERTRTQKRLDLVAAIEEALKATKRSRDARGSLVQAFNEDLACEEWPASQQDLARDGLIDAVKRELTELDDDISLLTGGLNLSLLTGGLSCDEINALLP